MHGPAGGGPGAAGGGLGAGRADIKYLMGTTTRTDQPRSRDHAHLGGIDAA